MILNVFYKKCVKMYLSKAAWPLYLTLMLMNLEYKQYNKI